MIVALITILFLMVMVLIMLFTQNKDRYTIDDQSKNSDENSLIEGDIYRIIMDIVKSLARGRLLEIEDIVESSDEALKLANSASSSREDIESIKVFKQRLAELKRLKDAAQALFKLFDSGLLRNILKTQGSKGRRADFK